MIPRSSTKKPETTTKPGVGILTNTPSSNVWEPVQLYFVGDYNALLPSEDLKYQFATELRSVLVDALSSEPTRRDRRSSSEALIGTTFAFGSAGPGVFYAEALVDESYVAQVNDIVSGGTLCVQYLQTDFCAITNANDPGGVMFQTASEDGEGNKINTTVVASAAIGTFVLVLAGIAISKHVLKRSSKQTEHSDVHPLYVSERPETLSPSFWPTFGENDRPSSKNSGVMLYHRIDSPNGPIYEPVNEYLSLGEAKSSSPQLYETAVPYNAMYNMASNYKGSSHSLLAAQSRPQPAFYDTASSSAKATAGVLGTDSTYDNYDAYDTPADAINKHVAAHIQMKGEENRSIKRYSPGSDLTGMHKSNFAPTLSTMTAPQQRQCPTGDNSGFYDVRTVAGKSEISQNKLLMDRSGRVSLSPIFSEVDEESTTDSFANSFSGTELRNSPEDWQRILDSQPGGPPKIDGVIYDYSSPSTVKKSPSMMESRSSTGTEPSRKRSTQKIKSYQPSPLSEAVYSPSMASPSMALNPAMSISSLPEMQMEMGTEGFIETPNGKTVPVFYKAHRAEQSQLQGEVSFNTKMLRRSPSYTDAIASSAADDVDSGIYRNEVRNEDQASRQVLGEGSGDAVVTKAPKSDWRENLPDYLKKDARSAPSRPKPFMLGTQNNTKN